jgi:hypothetical protein
LLVQVTVVPAGTVSVAGANAKLLMLTAFAPWGASDAAGAVPEPESAGMGMDVGMVPDVVPPTSPGVVAVPDPKVTEAGPAAGVPDEEQPVARRSAAAVITAAGASKGMR